MKRLPKLLQTDSRGQLVIPKEIREALNISEGTGFIAYLIDKEGIFLKKIEPAELADHPELKEIKEKAKAIGVNKQNVEHAEQNYKREKKERFTDI